MDKLRKTFKNLPPVIQAIEDVSYQHFLASVKVNGLKLEYIPKESITSEMCMAAVKQNGYALEFVPSEHFYEEMFSVVLNGPNSIFFTPSPKIQTIILMILKNKNGKDCLRYIPSEYLTQENCLEAVKLSLSNYNDVPLAFGTVDFYLAVLEHYNESHPNHFDAYKMVEICENPDYKTTVTNLKRLKQVELNKVLVSNTIKQIKD